MSKIGLLGGAFDPIHNGHLKIARVAMESAGLDRVIFIVGGVSPFKGRLGTSGQDRLNMVRDAIVSESRFSVSDFELKKNATCYTYDTVLFFKRLYEKDELFFIIGDDQYRLFDKWYKKDELLTLCKFLVVTRDGDEIKPPFIGVKMAKYPVSSSEIRSKAASGFDISESVPESVQTYILNHSLYK